MGMPMVHFPFSVTLGYSMGILCFIRLRKIVLILLSSQVSGSL